MNIEVRQNPEECKELSEQWDSLAENNNGILGKGISSTWGWSHTLWKNHLGSTNAPVLIVRNNNSISGILPLHPIKLNRWISGYQTLNHLYDTRNGLLSKDEATTGALFEHAFHTLPNSSFIRLTVIGESMDEKLLLESLATHEYKFFIGSVESSPHISIPEDADDLLKAMGKNDRKSLKRRERRLLEAATIQIIWHESSEESTRFFDNVLTIERNSWKEKAGSSITTNPAQEGFYRLYTPLAANEGRLKGALLMFDSTPIAYEYGILFNGVYEGLKTSFDQRYSEYSPGNVLQYHIIQRLSERGIRHYDLTGEMDDSKKMWTEQQYQRRTYTILRKNITGAVLALFQKSII